MAMGGAFTSLGGDFSSTLQNPAGLGMYRKSELVFSPGIGYGNTRASYLGQSKSDFSTQFINSNIGYVGTYNSGRKGLVSASFALGYNRDNNFRNNTLIRGENSLSTLADYFWDRAEGNDPETLDAFMERLAFDAYIIDTIAGGNFEYTTPVERPVDQRKTIESQGGSGEWTLATGLNFGDVFYFGLSLGFNSLYMKQSAVHYEEDIDNLTDFNYFRFTEQLKVEGKGFTARIGMMARIAEVIRLGASIQFPTYYHLSESYYNTLFSEFDNGSTHDAYPTDPEGFKVDGIFDYNLSSPLKTALGASIQIGKAGIISADAEYVNYAGMRLRPEDADTDFSLENDDIRQAYRSVVNLRMGGELRLGNVSLRLGGGYYPSPYAAGELNEKASYTQITSGIGYRTKGFFFDLGYMALFHSEHYLLYSAYNNEADFIHNTASLNQTRSRFVASMGVRF
jgi:hypothetical protein